MDIVHTMSDCCSNIYNNTPNTNGWKYSVQIGTFKLCNKAMELQLRLMEEGYLTDIEQQGEYYSVNAGNFTNLDDAVLTERYFRLMGFNTLVVAI